MGAGIKSYLGIQNKYICRAHKCSVSGNDSRAHCPPKVSPGPRGLGSSTISGRSRGALFGRGLNVLLCIILPTGQMGCVL